MMTTKPKILNAGQFLKSRPDIVLRVSSRGEGFLAILSVGVDGHFLAYEWGTDILSAILSATDYAQGLRPSLK